MAKHCIACKREIAPGQLECYICGSTQSFVRFYLRNVVIFLVLIATLAWFGYGYFDQMTKQAEAEKAIQTESKMQTAAKRIEELENLLVQANQHIQKAEANTAQSGETADEEKLKLDEAQKRAEKSEERAGWLSRENRRFKAKVKELTDQLAAAKQAAIVSNQSIDAANTQLTSLKQELDRFEIQKQTLTATISTKKEQLETSWQQASATDAIPAGADELARREQQIEQATADENNQMLLLNGQIEAVKKKILDIEGV